MRTTPFKSTGLVQLVQRVHAVCRDSMAKSPESCVDLSGCNVSVTVNNGSTSNAGRIGGGRQLVTITPLPPGARILPHGHSSGAVMRPAATEPRRPSASFFQQSGVASKLDKVFLKASCKGKKDVKKFTLRNVDPSLTTSSGDLKELIKANLHEVWRL